MPAPGMVLRMDEGTRAELDQRLLRSGFGDYQGLAEWLGTKGYEISTSTVYRYGAGLKRKLSAIRAATEAARMIALAAPDEEDRRSEAVMSLLQSDLFTVLVSLQEAEEADPESRVRLLSSAARAVADLSRASIAQKRHASAVQAKLDAIEDEARGGKSGLDVATVQRIKREVYGLAA
jgi:hypothetical protein